MSAPRNNPGWFTTKLIAPRTWGIDNYALSCCYLACGSERALLIDTGMGLGDLAGLVKSLTSLPLIVVNTHYHFDHSGGNGQFPSVYIGEADAARVPRPWMPFPIQRRFMEWCLRLPRFAQVLLMPFVRVLTIIQGRKPASALVPISDGYTFDLGDRQFEVIAVPGHSPGSICLLDRKERIMLTGDTVIGRILLHLPDSTPLHEYHRNLQRLQSYRSDFDRMFAGHNVEEWSHQALDDLVDGIGKILSGEAVGQKKRIEVGEGLCCQFGSIALFYDGNRL